MTKPSAFARVPVETWTEVFMFAASTDTQELQNPKLFNPRQEPWNISHTCSLWRQIALSCPKLWACLPVSVEEECLRLRNPLSLLQTSLERAMHRPRAITFFSSDDCYITPDPTRMAQLLRLLVDYSFQWRSAKIVSTYAPTLVNARMLSEVKGSLAMLEELTLHYEGAPLPAATFQDCPRLTSITLVDSSLPIPISPWPRLQSFKDFRVDFDSAGTADWVPDTYYHDVLANSPELRVLQTDRLVSGDLGVRTPHDKLSKLVVSDPIILDFFVLPALEELEVAARDPSIFEDGVVDMSNILLRFFTVSSCNLTSLTLVDVAPDEDFTSLLHLLTGLEHMRLSYERWTMSTVNLMWFLLDDLCNVDPAYELANIDKDTGPRDFCQALRKYFRAFLCCPLLATLDISFAKGDNEAATEDISFADLHSILASMLVRRTLFQIPGSFNGMLTRVSLHMSGKDVGSDFEEQAENDFETLRTVIGLEVALTATMLDEETGRWEEYIL